MGSPEATLASAEGVGTPEGVFEELSGTLQGWKRKISGKKGGTPKKKDVCFLAPDGEEVKNKRQLDKYLKAHPGTLTAADFDWGIPGGSPATPGDQPRRSARLTSKIRSLFDGLGHDSEVKQPSQKRSRKSRDHVKEKTVAGLSVDKKEENGEGKTEGAPTEENKAMDVDPSSAEAPAKTEVSTKEPVTGGVNVDDPSDTVIGKGAELDFAGGPGTEVSGKQQDAVPVNEDEKANGEKLATPILKTKEVELPQPQGLHALVDNTATFGEGPKPIEEEAPQARDAIMEPVGLSV
jgi:hypothetical protein